MRTAQHLTTVASVPALAITECGGFPRARRANSRRLAPRHLYRSRNLGRRANPESISGLDRIELEAGRLDGLVVEFRLPLDGTVPVRNERDLTSEDRAGR